MDYLVNEMVAYCHEERPHHAKGNDPLLRRPASESPPKKSEAEKKAEPPPDVVPLSRIECRQRLGGLLKHYYRKAA